MNREQKRAADKRKKAFDRGFRKLCRDFDVRSAYLLVEEVDDEKATLLAGGDEELVTQLDIMIRSTTQQRISEERQESTRPSGLIIP